MTAVLVRAAKINSGIRRDTSHMAFFMGRSVNLHLIIFCKLWHVKAESDITRLFLV